MSEKMLIDSSVMDLATDLAIEVCKDMLAAEPKPDQIDRLAEALQRAFEDWTNDIEAEGLSHVS